MATTTYTFNFGSSDYALTERGQNANLAYARDATDNAAKFTTSTKSATMTESGWGAETGVTWETWVGVSNIVVTDVQVTAWTEKTVSIVKLSANTVSMRILAGTTTVHSAGDLIASVNCGITADGTYQAGAAGTSRAVDKAYQDGLTNVRFELESTITTGGTGGSATVDQRFDAITITITYLTKVSRTPSVATLALAGALASRFLHLFHAPSAALLALTGNQPTVAIPVTRLPASSVVVLNGNLAFQTVNIPRGPPVAVLTLTGNLAVWVEASQRIPASAPLALSGNEATCTTARTLTPAAGTLTTTGNLASYSELSLRFPDTAAILLTGTQPVVGEVTLFQPSAAALTLIGDVPELTGTRTLTPASGVLGWVGGLCPALEIVGGDVTRTPVSAVLTWGGNQPGVSSGAVTYQWSVPIADTIPGTWTASEGATLYGCVDEEATPNDSDYITGTSGAVRFKMSPLNTPASGTATVIIRLKRVA